MTDFRNEKFLFYRIYKIGMILLLPIYVIMLGVGIYSMVFKKIEFGKRLYYIALFFNALTFELVGTECMLAKNKKLTGILMYLASLGFLTALILEVVI